MFSFVLLFLCALFLLVVRATDDPFRQCLISTPGTSLGYCLGVGAISKLRSLDADPEFDIVDGVTFAKDEQQLREGYNFVDRDPGDYRGILETMGEVLSRRNMRWDMSFLYPGLQMHLSPSISPGGVLEFALDPRREVLNQHSLKEASTGRLLARQFLVPFLLGFKFNIATLIPIIFGLLALIAKKAVVLSKIALVATSAFGLGSVLLGAGGGAPIGGFGSRPPGYLTHAGLHHHQHQGILHHGGLAYNTRYPEEDLFRDTAADANRISYPQDDLKLYEGPKVQEILQRNEATKGRNFAWSEAEKKENT